LLEKTFIHLPGVGEETERSLWAAGCQSWSCLLDGLDTYSIGSADKRTAERVLSRSIEAFEKREHWYFTNALGIREAWRAYPSFRNDAVYLDIETDGGRSGRSVTTIGMWDSNGFTGLVKGRDFDRFPDLIGKYRMIVTFFGTRFDIPMLQKAFPTVTFDQIHLDLCPTLRRVGLQGGLKKIEKQLGISRGDDVDGMNGLDAIRLWQRYRQFRDESALETLLAYNREDVANLVHLAEYAYDRLYTKTFAF
jgi:uncharacterized protein